MAAKQTIEVAHLGGIKAGYAISGSGKIEPSKPTFVLVNGMYMDSSLFSDQFTEKSLTEAANLLAIEPPGTGATTCRTNHWTYWDAASMALQVMDQLGVEEAYVLGTSAGGWIVARMALLAPDRIQGLIILGSSMDYESPAARLNGSWDAESLMGILLDLWSEPHPDFVLDGEGRKLITSLGFHPVKDPMKLAFWFKHLDEVYSGVEGQKKAKMCLVNILTRDGLLKRLEDIKCPVHWLQGSKDRIFGTRLPQEHIKLFTSAPRAKFTVVPRGGHYLNATSPREIISAMHEMLAGNV